ncbi:MAG: MG2 domain-containing protein [Chitinophagaceae bacterium]|nr:MG2 domain-containing protein [Chitinophagaceae bacterium]
MSKARLVLIFIIPIVLITMTSSAQQPGSPYEKEWKLVEDYVKKQQPVSALAEVKKIYTLASNQQQDAELLKALVYISDLQSENRENNSQLTINEWEKELAGKSPAVQAILNSLLAERYWNYFQAIRWQLYYRTKTAGEKTDDIATWDADAFHARIAELYKKSLADESLLQQKKVEAFNAIIIPGSSRKLRPTLFDLLAFRALSYFENDESMLSKPAYAFEIDKAAAFEPAADFVHHKFETTDTFSLQYQALLLYQRLIRFHLNDETSDALIDADLARIAFVRNKSTHPDKDQLYYTSINHVAHQYNQTPAAAQAWYLLANYHQALGQKYQPLNDTTYRYEIVRAREICQQIIDNKLKSVDSSEGWMNANRLLKEIDAKELDINVELVNLPAKPFLASVHYRNAPKIYLRLLKWDEKLENLLSNTYIDENLNQLEKWPTVRKWEQELPVTDDYQKHRTEIKIDGLETGRYILWAGSDPRANESSNVSGFGSIFISQISYFSEGQHYYVVNRETGQPLVGAEIQEWKFQFDRAKSENVMMKVASYRTDKNGYFKETINEKENYKSNYYLEFKHGKDHLFLKDQLFTWISRTNINKNKPQPSLFLFTDRSLYRPGQTLYVKGILMQSDNEGKNREIVVDYSTKLLLHDANGQLIDSVVVKSNEFGSFSAKFVLPSSGLTGQFYLYTKNATGSASVQVEEYKRPKFEVTYDPVKESYRVGDSITVTGHAKAYAGNNIDGAAVKYRVVRQARFPYPWWGRGWWPSSPNLEISHGTVTTDANGKFEIRFPAIPDKSIKPELNPFFDYVVYADVTDINGETRSGQSQVTAAYTALKMDISLDEKIPADSLHKISIVTQNMAGEFVAANVKATVWKLKTENRLIRESYWERPDQFVMTKEEFVKYFPFDEYANESDFKTWAKEKEMLSQSDSSRADGSWKWTNKKWSPGFYAIEFLTADAFGKEVKDIKYIEVYDAKQNSLTRPEYLWVEGSDAIEPGEQTRVILATSLKDVYLIQVADRTSRSEEAIRETFSWTGGQRTFVFDATEQDRGGYGVSWAFVKNNRFYSHDETIRVPWSNKELSVEYQTWRDKTLPGSEETWKLRITGNKKDKVAAELLGGMYDASLDQFYAHNWNKPSIYPYFYNRSRWSYTNFKSMVIYPAAKEYEYQDFAEGKTYDQLIGAGWSEFNERRLYALGWTGNANVIIRGMASAKKESTMDAMAASPSIQIQESEYSQDKDEDGSWDRFDSVQNQAANEGIVTRKNFNETAFFLPDLRTDSTGAIEFTFTLPEALTKWKFQALAHTKDLSFGYSSKEIVTQKELMIQPNPPRFLREGDKIELSAKVVNLSEKELSGEARIELLDAATNQPIDPLFSIVAPKQSFTAAAGQSVVVSFHLSVPNQFTQAITWRLIASAENYSDGEEASLPVLSNRMLVTESINLSLKGAGSRNYSFDKLKQSANSNTIQQHRVTVEYSSNPAWYAVQALPYLMEYPYECAEQNWNRYYANALATFVTNSSPRIREVFEQWKNTDTAALLSNLQKNEELKNILLEETPWVLEAKSETEQKKNIALLFDLVRMSKELNGSIEKLKQMQNASGAFPGSKADPMIAI